MEVDPMVTVPISKTVDLNKIESTAACLELIKECSERSPSKERSKTPMIHEPEQRPLAVHESRRISSEDRAVANHDEERLPDERRQAKSLDDGHRDESSSKRSEIALDQTIARSATPAFEPSNEKTLSGNERFERTSSTAGQEESIDLEATQREFKKLKEKALSLDSELSNEPRDAPAKTFERRRSKIFETAEKFNQMASNVENEKPKKIFIPGVNVGGAKRVFERKASLSSIGTPPPTKCVASKMIIDVPATDTKKNENSNDKSKPTRVEREEQEEQEQEQAEENEEEEKKKEEAKKRAIDIISGAIGKPPVQRRINGSPPISPSSQEPKKLPSKISVSTNDSRSTAQSLTTTPTETNFSFDEKTADGDGRATVRSTVRSTIDLGQRKRSRAMHALLFDRIVSDLDRSVRQRQRRRRQRRRRTGRTKNVQQNGNHSEERDTTQTTKDEQSRDLRDECETLQGPSSVRVQIRTRGQDRRVSATETANATVGSGISRCSRGTADQSKLQLGTGKQTEERCAEGEDNSDSGIERRDSNDV